MTLPRTRILIFVAVAFLFGCSSTTPNRNPVGEKFPTVEGSTLAGQEVKLPSHALEGDKPALLIVAYVQDAQFDVDRWLLGILDSELPASVYEVPTVEGIVPGLIAGTIDEGMRSGIPKEDWAIVITVYDDADKIVDFTGNENPRNARVLLLDAQGVVLWFHDEGYSAREMLELKSRVDESTSAPAP